MFAKCNSQKVASFSISERFTVKFELVFVLTLDKSSRPDVLCEKGVLRNFAKFTRKHLCQSLFFKKVASPATLLKKRLWHRCFPVHFANFLRTPFLTEHLWWLLLIAKCQVLRIGSSKKQCQGRLRVKASFSIATQLLTS